ncbi:hypothetical protein CcNV_102 [Crangon crangon nudivirus]|uniref:Uncharacterized protein n=1 Tax=Crangon crangon nudivirus TaxID=2880838 RepID=A0AAE9BZ42_9VIRU|nr:hypothetical protein QKT25_gp103 [Crangon crangon nudivirus]UBZ25587.1 hypothetical protein CcNV_102 [Crangon crangon nudivirus]
MSVFVDIVYMEPTLYKRAILYEHIEFVRIYPHRLYFNTHNIAYIQDEVIHVITPKCPTSQCIYIEKVDADTRTKIHTLIDNTPLEINGIFIFISLDITLYNVLQLIQNISMKLKQKVVA